MKKLIKLTLAVVLTVSATSLFAQKFGRINMQELIAVMPETQEMQNNLQTYLKDLQEQSETLQVELNNKITEFYKERDNMSEGVRNVREQELQDMQNRLREFNSWAEQDIQRKQAEMLEPIINKAQEAVNKIAKAGGYVGVFDSSLPSLAYVDETALTDIQPAVRAELGIAADAKPIMPQAQ
ncbi:MAG: OmpH family outer membrane protein [Alistipes sp.]|nr:OmpH family outer membrane protein [Alistipes sp.]